MARDYIIIYKDRLDKIFAEMKAKELSKSHVGSLLTFCFTLFVAGISTKEFNSVLGLDGSAVKIILWSVFACSLVISIVLFCSRSHQKREGKLDKVDLNEMRHAISDNSEYREDSTLILLFPHDDKEGALRYPVQRKGSWGNSFFFPYVDDVYGSEDLGEDKDRIKSAIAQKYEISAEIKIFHLYDLDTESVKLTSDNFPKKFNYRFVYVTAKSPFFNSSISESLTKSGFKLLSLDQMLADKTTANHNADVISMLKDHPDALGKIQNLCQQDKSKIVWNIDKICKKSCVFCAYGDQENISNSLTLIEKKEVIDSMESINIDHLDFATGDSPNISELKAVIRHSKAKLNSSLSLTATSEVLNDMGVDFIKEFLDYVEITYDYPKGKLNKYRPESFSKNNHQIASNLIKNGVKVEALVVLYKNLTKKNLKTIKTDLSKIGVEKILLIRLMPVGKQAIDEYPETLLHKKTYLETMGLNEPFIKNNNLISIHCSLQGLEKKGGHTCELANNKLGISHSGDVYACPWAEHLNDDTNPFLIGNALHDAKHFYDLLRESNNFNEIMKNHGESQPHCKIFSYASSNDLFSKSDALYKQ